MGEGAIILMTTVTQSFLQILPFPWGSEGKGREGGSWWFRSPLRMNKKGQVKEKEATRESP